MPRIVVLGEALIDLFADEGVALGSARTLRPAAGGAPANVAVALGRLGARVGFIGKVGDDPFGHYLRELLAANGVEVGYTLTEPRAPTMLSVVARPAPDEQQFILYHGANELLTPEDIPETYLKAVDILVYGSVTLASRSRTAAFHAAHLARAAGKQVIFDVNLRPTLWPDPEEARKLIIEAVSGASVVKLNRDELVFLGGEEDLEQACRRILEWGPRLCCVTLGADGVFFLSKQASGHVPAFSVPVRDTTGSGDAFVAGLAFSLARRTRPLTNLSNTLPSNEVLCEVFRFANACGALAATELGAMSAHLTLEAVQRLLRGK